MQGCDYSFWRATSASDLSGYDFVCRYLSGGSSKDLTHAEAVQLTSWNKLIVANWESSGQGGDHAQGVADATAALAEATACGMPAGKPIYFSIDADVSPSSTDDYRNGVLSVLPGTQVGIYGSAAVVQHWRANGVAYGWRTMSTDWSGGSSTQDCHLVQSGGNNNVDFDTALVSDFGGWNLNTVPTPVPVPPAPVPVPATPKEDELMQIDPKSQQPNGQAFALNGKYTVMSLVADGFGAKTSVRFAFWVGKSVSVENIECGGGSIGHGLPTGCTGVTVTRNDTANIPVGISFS